jgi:dTDP-4-amino-4,6-dideoxygalactose transaminase
VLSTKPPRLNGWNARRRVIAAAYSRNIVHPRVVCPPVPNVDNVAHLYVLRCADRDTLRSYLHAKGVCAEIHYPLPDHKQIALERWGNWPKLPITEKLTAEILTVPCFPEMTDDEIARVIAAVNEWGGS